MALFHSHEKQYFVFAGEGDRYFLDSMIQLDTKEYLWYELKSAQYESVYYIDSSGPKYTIKAIDERSIKRYNASCTWPFYSRPEIMQGKTSVEIDPEKLRKWITDIIVKNCNVPTVVVFSLYAFCSLYADDYAKKHLSKMIERPLNRNSVIIQASMRLHSEQHSLLVDKKGVFAYATESGKSFCPELRGLILKDKPVPALEMLKQQLGPRMIELNAVTYARFQTLMRCIRFQKGEDWSEEELLQYTSILYNWWHLDEIKRNVDLQPKFLQMWGNFCYEEKKRTDIYVALFGKLCSTSGWKAFQDRVRLVLNNSNAYSEKQFLSSLNRPEVEAKCHVTLDDAVLSEIAQIPWPGDVYSQTIRLNPTIDWAIREKWVSMQEALLIPGNHLLPNKRLDKLVYYYQRYKKALENKDYETLCRAINAMLFAGMNLYETSDEFDYDQRLEDYRECLERSEQYHEVKSQKTSDEPDSAAGKSWALSQSAIEVQYREWLKAMDYKLKITPQMTQTLDVKNHQKAILQFSSMKGLEQKHLSENEQVEMSEIELTADEADQWLHEKYGKAFFSGN